MSVALLQKGIYMTVLSKTVETVKKLRCFVGAN